MLGVWNFSVFKILGNLLYVMSYNKFVAVLLF